MTKLCVKDGGWQREEAGGGGEATRDTESKTRTPHKVVGNYLTSSDPHPGKLHTDRIACDMARAHWCPQGGRRRKTEEGGKERRREGEKEGRREGGKERRREGVSKTRKEELHLC